MNTSALASEFILRSLRNLKEAKEAYEDGDTYYTLTRAYECLNNISNTLLAMYGIYVVDGDPIFSLEYLNESRDIDEKLKSAISEIQDLGRSLNVINYFDESSLKSPSILARDKELRDLLEKISKIVELVQDIFDDFHT
ncbi:hypothetical protein DFR86_03085 [Acidianus sulfidivorans JP7]|uniref:HEPN domain-containing protein n=1 Tax=Acidianus sulfidivorans JP7 TaxID=619593 RepID=A0A2U9IKV1_9CREN|nr:hypothetical protein [Acidianus sulfidivorans]AWR96636.1 hypothetical protein DFR86_03085 [Acidianus sulfidivorans JP7]